MLKKFNPQSFTDTQSKKIAQSDRLHALFKFIKFNYILPGHELKTTTKDFYEDYLKYCSLTNSTQIITKNKTIKILHFHKRIMKLMKILEFHIRIRKL